MASSPRPVARLHAAVQRIDELRRELEEAERRFETALRRCEQLGSRAVRARILYESAREAPEALFRREGEFWTIAFAGHTCRLRDVKGLRYLAFLLAAAGRDVHVLELASAAAGLEPRSVRPEPDLRAAPAELDAALDARAKDAYRRRLEELGDDLRQARRWGDPERTARIEEEIDVLTRELARAIGLGGRDRRGPSAAERARVSVTKAIRSAIRAIGRHHPDLGAHLAASVRTGRLCTYAPPGESPPRWAL
jgi:hypothetical protein